MFSITEAAKRLRVSTKTLRRWEKRGFVTPSRTPGGQRRYSEEDIAAIAKPTHETHETHETHDFLRRVIEKLADAFSAHHRLAAGLAVLALASAGTLAIAGQRLTVLRQTQKKLTAVTGAVLATATDQPDFIFTVNVPAAFNGTTTFTQKATFTNDVEIGGTIIADNLITALAAGDGITVTAGTTPKVTNTGVLSLAGKSGKLDMEAGGGITLDGLKITNSDRGTSVNVFKTLSVSGQSDVVADGNTDTLTFAGGTGIAITTDASSDTLTITGTNPGITDGGALVYLTAAADAFGVGITSGGSAKLMIDSDLGGDLLTASSSGSMRLVLTNGGNLQINGALNAGGITGRAYNSFATTGDAPEEAGISAANDVYIGGDIEIDGTIYGQLSGGVTTGFSEGAVAFANASGVLSADGTNLNFNDTTNTRSPWPTSRWARICTRG